LRLHKIIVQADIPNGRTVVVRQSFMLPFTSDDPPGEERGRRVSWRRRRKIPPEVRRRRRKSLLELRRKTRTRTSLGSNLCPVITVTKCLKQSHR
jgi:hypothetical protein